MRQHWVVAYVDIQSFLFVVKHERAADLATVRADGQVLQRAMVRCELVALDNLHDTVQVRIVYWHHPKLVFLMPGHFVFGELLLDGQRLEV